MNDLAFHSKLPLLAAGCENGKVYIWDIPTGEEDLPEYFTALAEAIGGIRIDEEGRMTPTTHFNYNEVREMMEKRLSQNPNSDAPYPRFIADEYRRFATEYFGFSKTSLLHWIEIGPEPTPSRQ